MAKRTGYEPYDFFMLRAPLLPVGYLSSIPGDPEELDAWIRNQWQDPLIREGIMLASHEFFRQAGQHFSTSGRGSPVNGLELALLRYLCRFASRCTPFGIFAGFATGAVGETTSFELCHRTQHELHTRPDMEYLAAIGRWFESDPELRECLDFSPNSTLYRIGEEWHYIEVKRRNGRNGKIYDVVTIEDQGVVEDLLAYCSGGRKPSEIRAYLEGCGFYGDEVTDYVDSLIDSQVLVSNLEPVVCGPEYIGILNGTVQERFPDHPLSKALGALVSVFNRMNRPLAVTAGIPELEGLLPSIPITVNRNHLIQTDLKLNAHALSVDSKLNGQVLLAVRIARALSGRQQADHLAGFREAFRKRFGDRHVELVRVLDPETGIGLDGTGGNYWTDPVPWIDDLDWGRVAGQIPPGSHPGNAWLNARCLEAIRQGLAYIELVSADFPAIGLHDGPWPDQLTAMVELYHLDRDGEPLIRYLMGFPGNPSNLLGRFGFADPGATRTWTGQLVDDACQASADRILAEVVHLPEDRSGNVLQRPSYLVREIPYLARSVCRAENRIPVTDLLVYVEDDRILLESSTTGVQIMPCMTNAYNHQLGHLSLYKFLHLLHLQDMGTSYQADFGDIISQSRFIPGIRFKNIILASPVWTVDCAELGAYIRPGLSKVDVSGLAEWRRKRGMPSEMAWMASDQELYVNWEKPVLVLSLWDAIHTYRSVRMRPFYLSAGTPVKSQDGSHANQLIFCYRKS